MTSDRFFENGHPYVWATLFIDEQIGVLANAYSQVAYRGKGYQKALRHRRIADAMSALSTVERSGRLSENRLPPSDTVEQIE